MMLTNTIDKAPWYKQFWPWFVFGLPALTVVAGVITVVIAIRHADTLVVDDYYKEGLAINQDLKAQARALEMDMTFDLAIDQQQKQLKLTLSANEKFIAPDFLLLKLIHPFDSAKDLLFPLQKQQSGFYIQQFNAIEESNWTVELSPLNPEKDEYGDWKLRRKL